ncbi:MAG: DegT/DnrJ/EryC1/StrS family aminotransferase [Tenuifilaceae bacterium]|jgi:dTDP-4-amino-4,6-dideoxygalactose transaminase|nr:DegT/DnrJ/EryC1/StrS family aminotransferase [Bacteroidales bacterium]NLH55530.1 DegT/DnrJ/EryC1/StrS family aminotransferase [Rikenellaceae bacterium]OQC65237.1 MAG: UDP-4-amino-4-deoxy-L-arabinose--oxoglutarate aminotransferase [Bacteroidetes bacterium ADurb.Bin008]HOM85538.1 DegT/DnrJ/EryC1/StrS family aminotransferase [Tenuifilaceae bacterium]HOU63427.1 DegT/DnrJ/EryC1/StrS family aminotransferase [Tenuifilaceae bacterium]
MGYTIPLFDLNFDEAEEQSVLEVLRSKWISTGPKTLELENLFAQMLGARHALTMANCTVALHLAMLIVGIQKGDEVICPSLTFVATANAIRYVGAIPIFADIVGNDNLNIDPEDINRKITPRTKAIVVMHYGGFACNMDQIMDIAKKHNLKVIEDACHGPLSEYKGKKLGTIGDVGCFSFFSNKNISTGEGGMLVTNDTNYFERAKLLRSHGMTTLSYERAKGHSTTYDVVELGYNYRMDDIRAAIGIVQLAKLKDDLLKRVEVRKNYEEMLKSLNKIVLPFMGYPCFSSNYIFPIVLKTNNKERRNEVREELAKRGIQTSVHYQAVHRFSIYKEFYTHLPKTDYVAENMITLPMYSKLTPKNISTIVEEIKKIV